MSQMPPSPQPPGYGSPLPPGYGNPPPPGYGNQPPGYPPGQGYGGHPQQPQRRTSGAAIASLVFGLLGCIPFITSAVAVILGIVGIRSTGKPNVGGRGLAIAGLILGLLGIIGWSLSAGGLYTVYVASRPARDTAKQFAMQLGSGNVQAAQAMSGGSVTPDELQAAGQKLQAWGGVSDTTLVGVQANNVNGRTTWVLGGAAHLPNNQTAEYVAQLVKEGDTLKVVGFRLRNPATNETVAGGTAPEQVGNQ